VFAEKYDVISRLGSGGMSTVYRAKHKFFEKEVAIKVLKGNAGESSDSLKRFQREARATVSISHPGIVGVSDFGLTPDGRAFLVMDYLDGESLSHFLDRVGRLTVSDMIDIAGQLCDALAVAHGSGIVHRDLKPSNIMLVRGEEGEMIVKIVDFGLAKILDEDHQASLKITQTGDCFGSPLYMSPEQCMGKKVDHRCDIYALGCILFECLTGNPPIIGNNAADTITKHVQERPAAFPEGMSVPKEIKLIIYKALHKEAMWRPQTVMEIKDALAGSLRNL
jgi:serine/threonine-protein kinase